MDDLKSYKIIILLLLIIGLIETIFSFSIFIWGIKSKAIVTDVSRFSKGTTVTFSYLYINEQYTKKITYPINRSIKTGDFKNLYFFKSNPQKSYTLSMFIVYYFVVIISVIYLILLHNNNDNNST